MADENFKEIYMVCELNYIHLYDDEDMCLIFDAEFGSDTEAQQYIKESKSYGRDLYILPLKKYIGLKR